MFVVIDHGVWHSLNVPVPQICKLLQGAVDAMQRSVRYTLVCGQSDKEADAVPCVSLQFILSAMCGQGSKRKNCFSVKTHPLWYSLLFTSKLAFKTVLMYLPFDSLE
jgi:hypothetical protein